MKKSKLIQQQAEDLAECKRLISEILKIINKPYPRSETAVRWEGPAQYPYPWHGIIPPTQYQYPLDSITTITVTGTGK